MSSDTIQEELTEIRLPIKFRKYQLPLYTAMETKKRAIIVYHRRAGKDITCWNIMLIKALTQRKGAYYYVFPSFRQARKAIWEAIDNDGRRFLDYIPRELLVSKPNSSEMKIELKSGSIIRLLGSDDFDSIRGTNPVGVVFSEFAYQKPEIWSQIVEPALRINGGWAIFNSTPYGKNHFYKMYMYAKQYEEDWYHQIATIDDTGIVEHEELDALREQGVSEEAIAQEYLCSFDRGVEGSYYGRILRKLRDRGQICNCLHDEYASVHTAWDIGHSATAIWWFQVIRGEIHFIDHFEMGGEGTPYYARVIDERAKKEGYRYGTHFAPHDIRQSEKGTGTTMLHLAAEVGLNFQVLPLKPIDTGIEIVRRHLMKSYIDETKCRKGIECLEGYQKRWDAKHRVYGSQPLGNWCAHSADAMRYACTAIEDYLLRDSSCLTPESLADLKRQAKGGGDLPFPF